MPTHALLLLALPVHVARALALAFDLEPCGLFAKLSAMSLVQGFEAIDNNFFVVNINGLRKSLLCQRRTREHLIDARDDVHR